MGLNDLPKIDKYSKNADTSEIKFREIFNQQNNFICRTDVPDKGCDFDIELIYNNGASDWRFPVQIKSIESLKLINDSKYISYSFETSRLGYLLRRPISGGLIILYSLTEDICFFDYADAVYFRLIEERESEDWKQNDQVNIRIPYTNILNNESSKEIYAVFLRRFEQGVKMQNTHGIKYGIPVISDGEFKYDFTNTEHLKKFLRENGFLFLYNHDFDILFQAISRLPSVEINSDKSLLILSIVVYSEAAQYIESEFFITKLKKRFTVTEEENLIVTFQGLKNKLMLGYIDNSEFINELNEIKFQNQDTSNLVTVKINILRYKVLEYNSFSSIPKEFETDCKNIFHLIDQCNCTEKIKNLFRIWNSEIESIIINDNLRNSLNAVKLKEAFGVTISDSEKITHISSFISSQSQLLNRLNEIYKWAISKNDKIIQGNSLSAYVTHFIQKEIIFLSWDLNFSKKPSLDYENQLKLIFNFALNGYNCFVELNMLKEAHYNLCNAIEILFEAEMIFNASVEEDKNNLLSVKQILERESDIQPYDFQLPKLINNIRANESKKEDSSMAFTKGMTEEQILYLAKTYMESFSLPEERIENIINEIKAYRLFYQRCQDDNIMVLQASDYLILKSDHYKEPIKFILRSKLTGIETSKSSDMDMLLTSWGF